MFDNYGIYVVAYRKFTRSNVVCGIFPNEKEAVNYRNAFHSTAKIYLVPKNGVYFGDYGIEMRESFVPLSI